MRVCIDRNENDICDADERSVRTDTAGRATLVADLADAGKHPMIAMVGTDATDQDYGRVPVAYVLKTPSDLPGFVTPLSTMVQAAIEDTGMTTYDATLLVSDLLGLEPAVFVKGY